MKKEIIRLVEPIEIGGKQTGEIEMRASTIGDEEDALQMAIQMKRSANNLTVEMCLYSILTNVPFDKIRMMNSADYAALRQTHLRQIGKIMEADAENPMTQDEPLQS